MALNETAKRTSARPVRFSDSNAAPSATPATVLYIGDTENKFVHLEAAGLAALGVRLDSAAKIPDVIVHHRARNWLLLIEAVTSAGPVDGKRRKELKDLLDAWNTATGVVRFVKWLSTLVAAIAVITAAFKGFSGR